MVCVVFPKRYLLARLKSNFQSHPKQRICWKRALVESQNFSFGRKSFVRFLTWPWTPESPWESSKAPCGSGLWHSPRTGEHRFHVDVVLRCFVWLITQISLKSLQVGRHVLCVTATGLKLREKVGVPDGRGGGRCWNATCLLFCSTKTSFPADVFLRDNKLHHVLQPPPSGVHGGEMLWQRNDACTLAVVVSYRSHCVVDFPSNVDWKET